jgi:hypothetical protein
MISTFKPDRGINTERTTTATITLKYKLIRPFHVKRYIHPLDGNIFES